jgi:uracil-DNA glycosylase family 4
MQPPRRGALVEAAAFDPRCTRCARIVAHLAAVRARHPDDHAAPVAAFGPWAARLLIVGLAPGPAGANRTGRPFTRDASARLLFTALHAHGFASSPLSLGPGDGMRLRWARITNALRCLPPANRPLAAELAACRPFLAEDVRMWLRTPAPRCLLALGRVAHDAVLAVLGIEPARAPFAHGAQHALAAGSWLLASYHPSPQNVHTGRLTAVAFGEVVARARGLLDAGR